MARMLSGTSVATVAPLGGPGTRQWKPEYPPGTRPCRSCGFPLPIDQPEATCTVDIERRATARAGRLRLLAEANRLARRRSIERLKERKR